MARVTKKQITEAVEAKHEMDRLKKIVDTVRKLIEEVNIETGQSEFQGQNPNDIVVLSVYPQTALSAAGLEVMLRRMDHADDFYHCVTVAKTKVKSLNYLTPAQIASITTKTGEISKVTWPRIKK